MRILLVHAEFPTTFWGFQHTLAVAGRRAALPPLGLVTVAAHLPKSWPIRLVDTNVQALGDADLLWADAVLVGGMRVQSPSIHLILARARALGRRTVVGGPAASATPEEFPEADIVFCGELEGREAELETAITSSRRAPAVLRPDGDLPSMALARTPRFDLLDMRAYVSMAIQYSRGCPFACEFCDVIELFGRTPRVKSREQVLTEVTALHDLGHAGTIFFVDDNFVANRAGVRQLLPLLERWQTERGYPMEFYTEASVDLARDEELVRDLRRTGFSALFLGLETPSTEALRAAGKRQNLACDLGGVVDSLTRAGIEVMGGFIVGFDSDGPDAFEAQRRFIARAPIPTAMISLLNALPGTALWRRLAREGRLRSNGSGDTMAVRQNFVPAMDEAVLLDGYARLLADLYQPDAYLERCVAYLDRAPAPFPAPRLRRGAPAIIGRSLLRLGLLGERRGLYWKLVAHAAARSPRHLSWAIVHALQGEHFVRFTHEDVLPKLRLALQEVCAESRRAKAA